jgi:hypothetical protein
MNKKKFLPTNKFEVDECQPIIDNQHKNAAFLLGMKDHDLEKNTLGYYDMINIETLNKKMIKSLKTKSWLMNILSIFTFLTLLFGGTLFGFSFKLVGEKQIGYYNNEIGYYEPGSYFQFPWMKQQFHIINVGIEHLQLHDITGYLSTDNVTFTIKTINIIYTVNDIDLYVKAIKDIGGVKQFLKLMEIQIANEIINNFKHRSIVDIEQNNNIPIIMSDAKEYGISIKNSHTTKPFLHTHQWPTLQALPQRLKKQKMTTTLKLEAFKKTTLKSDKLEKTTSKEFDTSEEPEETTSEPEETTSKEPKETTSKEPKETTSEEPKETTSEEPEETTSEEPKETTSEEPEETTSEEPKETTSEEPEKTTSEEPEETTSEEPEETTSEEPKETTSEEPEETTSKEPEETTSKEPEETTSKEPEETTSKEPEEMTSEEPEEMTSEKPEETTSKEPEETTSKEPEEMTSEEPEEMTSEEPEEMTSEE